MVLPDVPEQPHEEPTPQYHPPELIVMDAFEEEEFVPLEPPTIPAAPVAPKFGKPQVCFPKRLGKERKGSDFLLLLVPDTRLRSMFWQTHECKRHGYDWLRMSKEDGRILQDDEAAEDGSWVGAHPFQKDEPLYVAPKLMDLPTWRHPPRSVPLHCEGVPFSQKDEPLFVATVPFFGPVLWRCHVLLNFPAKKMNIRHVWHCLVSSLVSSAAVERPALFEAPSKVNASDFPSEGVNDTASIHGVDGWKHFVHKTKFELNLPCLVPANVASAAAAAAAPPIAAAASAPTNAGGCIAVTATSLCAAHLLRLHMSVTYNVWDLV
eukprot:scaffold154613_cov17-Tisochrysis_lutea.AAC.2